MFLQIIVTITIGNGYFMEGSGGNPSFSSKYIPQTEAWFRRIIIPAPALTPKSHNSVVHIERNSGLLPVKQ